MRRNDGLTLAADERGYVPFAVIGVFLLVTSVAVIAVLETRSEPEVDTDAAQAYDRTSSTVQAALRSAATDALQDAAAQPVTQPDSATDVGQALAAGPTGGANPDEVFSRYVQLRVYLEARAQLPNAGQSIRGDTVTNVSVPHYADPADAIDALTLHVGGDGLDYGDPGGSDLPDGAVRVTIPDVEVTVQRDGAVVATRTRDYTVTVGSSVFELHHRTSQYEDALNTDLGNDTGFGRHLAARLFRVGYQRGHAQANGSPVAQVLADRHLETLANDAVFATQRDAFGAQDPYANRTLARAYGCMLAEDHHAVYDDPTGGSTDLGPVLDRVDDPGFCDGAGTIYDDLGGALSGAAAPNYTRLAGPDDFLAETDTVDLDETANATLGDLATRDRIQAAIDRAYAVDVTVGSEVDRTIPVGDPDASNTDLHDYSVTVQEPELLLDPDASGRLREYYRIPVVFSGWFDRGGTVTNVRYDVTLTVRGEHSPAQRVEERGLVTDYEQGPRDSRDVLYGRNYVGAPDLALEAALAGVNDSRRADDQLEAYLQENAGWVRDGEDVVAAATVDGGNVTVQQPPSNPDALRAWLFQDLRALQRNVSAVSESYARHELLAGTGPLDALADGVASDDPWVYTHVDDGRYRNVPDLARAEARLAFIERVRDRINQTVRRHNQTLAAVDRRLRSHAGANGSETANLARTQLSADPYAPSADRPAHQILENVTVTPDGEPTYLTFDRVDATQVPAAGRPPAGFAPIAARHENDYAAPYDVRLPGNGTGSTVHLRTAGEVLRAGQAVDDVRSAGWASGDVGALETALDAELDATIDDAAGIAAAPFPTLDRSALATAIDAEVASLGPLERRAIRLGGDNRTIERVADRVAERFEDGDHPTYRYWRGDRHVHLSTSVRAGLQEAIGEGYVDAATASDTIELAGRIRSDVGGAAADVREARRRQAAADTLANESVTAPGRAWLASDPTVDDVAPASVSAGIDTTNLPEWNLLTLTLWTVDLEGEYARFVVRSTGADPTGTPATYVRENGTVRLTVDGREQVAGRTEALGFESDTAVLVGVPPDSLGVGDRTDTFTECSDTYDVTGSVAPSGPAGVACP